MRKLLIIITIAFAVLCCTDKEREGIMRRKLLEAKAHNEDFRPFTTDSTMKEVVKYYDRHGSPNDRMTAYYLLGCVYRDLGDVPRALQCYNDAVGCADTTSADCDYAIMSRIYGQMAVLFSDNEIPQSAVSSLQNVIRYGTLADDTLIVLQAMENMANAYYHQNEFDSVVAIRERVSARYARYGYTEFAALALGPAIHILIEKGEYEKAGKYIDVYERESGVFDSCGNIGQGREIYNAFKGNYYLGINEYDSAEACFRKCISQDNSMESRAASFDGLHSLYIKKNEIDSVAKYAELSAVTNDSIYSGIVSNSSKIIKDLSASNTEKDRQLMEVDKNRWPVIFIMAVFAIVVAAFIFRWINHDKKCSKGTEDDNKDIIISGAESEESGNGEQSRYVKCPEKTVSEKAEIEKALCSSEIYVKFKNLSADMTVPSNEDWAEMLKFVDKTIPDFHKTVNNVQKPLRIEEYYICILVRLHFSPYEQCRLIGKSSSYISMTRARLLKKIFGMDGKTKEFDKLICDIY